MEQAELKEYLDELEFRYNQLEFIESDPISIPHLFTDRQDIEIAALLSSTIAWGKRSMILKNARSMVERMDMSPAAFVAGASDMEIISATRGFVHRTFNEEDFVNFLVSIRNLCAKWGSLGNFFEQNYLSMGDIRHTLASFRSEFLPPYSLPRTTRHVSSIAKGSACKRLCMMLRWMVRRDDRGVDFGLWSAIPASALYVPLDVHSARQGRALGLLTRKQDDWRAVEELTASLRTFDPLDPTRYDFSLFGAGVFNQR